VATLAGVAAPAADLDGNPRPQGNAYDIGAYEVASGTTVTPPAAPSNLAATAANATAINLSWNDNSTNETGFRIERATATGTFAPIATLAAGSTGYTDAGLGAGTQYTYRVCATNSAGDSPFSNSASATTTTLTTPPAAPSNLAAAAAG